MAGNGTGGYTTYLPLNSNKKEYLRKLFAPKDASSTRSYFNKDNLTEAELRDPKGEFLTTANTYLSPNGKQDGDSDFFPGGVYLNFQSDDAPDFSKPFEWKQAGDPANWFYPDLRAPGANATNESDVNVNFVPLNSNPEIKIEDLKPNYIPGVFGTDVDGGGSTVSPKQTAEKIVDNNDLGKALIKGQSYPRP